MRGFQTIQAILVFQRYRTLRADRCWIIFNASQVLVDSIVVGERVVNAIKWRSYEFHIPQSWDKCPIIGISSNSEQLCCDISIKLSSPFHLVLPSLKSMKEIVCPWIQIWMRLEAFQYILVACFTFFRFHSTTKLTWQCLALEIYMHSLLCLSLFQDYKFEVPP